MVILVRSRSSELAQCRMEDDIFSSPTPHRMRLAEGSRGRGTFGESTPRCSWITSTGNLNDCHARVRLGVVEAINGNSKSLLRRGSGYKNLCYLPLRTQRLDSSMPKRRLT